MCGIVGYLGDQDAAQVILAGLRRLEYRGYDSAGVATAGNGFLGCVKTPGKLSALETRLAATPLRGSLGVGHTRWATHGAPSEANAHPHLDTYGTIAVVHNGIIENYGVLRARLQAEGIVFRSQTDTEVLAHLVRKHYSGDLVEAVRLALREVRGAYAIGVISRDHPDLLVAARHGSPLVVGLGDGETFVASDVPAIMRHTRRVIYLDNGSVCAVRRGSIALQDLDGAPLAWEVKTIDWDEDAAEKEGFPHFMLKEICQQPDVIRGVLRGRTQPGSDAITLEGVDLSPAAAGACPKVVVVACGTAWHAGLVGKYLLEHFARVPVEVDIASEFRYREPILAPGTLVVAVSQSGETADTLEAVRIARECGARVVSVVNVVGSSVARESDCVIYTQAGPEIGVASTKAYTSQLTAFALFALWMGRARGVLSGGEVAAALEHLHAVPGQIQWVIDHHDDIRRCAEDPRYRDPRSMLYLGRSFNFPSAMEGALKLKEISYIHAEGYAAGEMKHGPIALVTHEWPVVCICVRGATYEKMVSNIQEICARSGIVLGIATEGDEEIRNHCADVIYVPDCYEPFSPIVVAPAIQLFAYYVARNRGCDVDQPRNLAKSVTVE